MNIQKIIMVTVILNCFVPAWQWNDKYLYNLLIGMLPMMETREVVWFISQQLNTNQSAKLDNFIRNLVTVGKMAQYVWTNWTDIRMVELPSKRNGLTLAFTTGAMDPIMDVVYRVMSGRHAAGIMFVYVSKVASFTPINEICRYLHKGSYFLSFVYFETDLGHNQLFGYEQYPTFLMENRTDIKAYTKKMLKRMLAATQDVGGYKFFTPIKKDLPRVFKSKDKHGNWRTDGTAYRLLETFILSMNGSLEEYIMPNDTRSGDSVNMKNVLELVRSRTIDISTHAYALYQSDDDLDKSYPIMVVQWCLMVPQRNSVSTYLYLVQPFETIVWILVVSVWFLLWCLDFMRLLWHTIKWKKSNKFFSLLSDAWLNDFCIIFNMPTSKAIRVATWMRFYLYVAIFFFGFFLSANYTSYLGSSLTVTLFKDQINSMDDLIKAQLPVMVVDYELEFLLSERDDLHPSFLKLLRPVDTATFQQHQFQFNTSFAYFVTDDIWHFLNAAQKHLSLPPFKLSKICFGSYHLAYPIQKDSAIWRDLEYYLFHTYSNGFIMKYEQAAFRRARSAGYIQRLMETHEYSSAGWEHLVMLFAAVSLGYVLGGISLIVEICMSRPGRKAKKITK